MTSLLTQGVRMPRIGLGTFRMPPDTAQESVEHALSLGYRHIDTAAMYGTEPAVGAALRASGLKRSDVFVTSKVWHDQLAPDAIRRSLNHTLERLGSGYLDLFMVHWPSADMDLDAVMRTLIDLKDQGMTRSNGVCNFNRPMLEHVIDKIRAPIAAVQLEYHPFLDQASHLEYLQARQIPLVAYCPLAQGRVAEEETLVRIGKKHSATSAQVALAWLLHQPGVVVIPKASSSVRQQENLKAAGLVLDDADRLAIDGLPKASRYVQPTFAPDWNATSL
jgi:2,5-diketo-D-gluconate reductase B